MKKIIIIITYSDGVVVRMSHLNFCQRDQEQHKVRSCWDFHFFRLT